MIGNEGSLFDSFVLSKLFILEYNLLKRKEEKIEEYCYDYKFDEERIS